MTAITPRGSTAVMARRVEPPDSLDYFPTPPWATRALFEHVIGTDWNRSSAWDPACGEGHMSGVLEEYFDAVYATDIFDYRRPDGGYPYAFYRALDFLSDEARDWQCLTGAADWIITNPPFKVAAEFLLRALSFAKVGVALLVRTSWLESQDRYERVFKPHPPTIFAPFVERVPMVKGRWDPEASTATAYAWFVWMKSGGEWGVTLIPPGCRRSLTRPADVRRYAQLEPAPLLD